VVADLWGRLLAVRTYHYATVRCAAAAVLVMLENRFPTLMLMGDDDGDGLFVMRESNFPLL
jgi:hypothetical protein